MTRLLITGGTGFVGLAAAEAAASRGAEIVLFAPAPVPEAFRDASFLQGAEIVIGDIRAPDDIARALDCGPTHILHAAAITPDETRERADPASIAAVNVGGTLNLLQAVAARGIAPRIVVLSSASAYGFTEPGPDGLYDEVLTRPAPPALYGITKLAAELAALRLASLYGLHLTAIRLGPVFGPWEHRSGARDLLSPHAQAAEAARAGLPVRLPRPMRSDWLYSRDAGAGIAAVLVEPVSEPVLNLGGPVVTDLAAWCRLLASRHPGFSWSIDPGSPTIRYGLPQDRPALSNSRILAATTFRHRFDPAQAFADHMAWLDGIGGVTGE